MSIRFEDIGLDKLIQEGLEDSYRVGYIHGYFDFYCRADDSTEEAYRQKLKYCELFDALSDKEE